MWRFRNQSKIEACYVTNLSLNCGTCIIFPETSHWVSLRPGCSVYLTFNLLNTQISFLLLDCVTNCFLINLKLVQLHFTKLILFTKVDDIIYTGNTGGARIRFFLKKNIWTNTNQLEVDLILDLIHITLTWLRHLHVNQDIQSKDLRSLIRSFPQAFFGFFFGGGGGGGGSLASYWNLAFTQLIRSGFILILKNRRISAEVSELTLDCILSFQFQTQKNRKFGGKE